MKRYESCVLQLHMYSFSRLDLASTVLIEIADPLQASLRNVTKLPFIPKILLHYKRLVRESRTNPEETAHAIVSLARLLTYNERNESACNLA